MNGIFKTVFQTICNIIGMASAIVGAPLKGLIYGGDETPVEVSISSTEEFSDKVKKVSDAAADVVMANLIVTFLTTWLIGRYVVPVKKVLFLSKDEKFTLGYNEDKDDSSAFKQTINA